MKLPRYNNSVLGKLDDVMKERFTKTSFAKIIGWFGAVAMATGTVLAIHFLESGSFCCHTKGLAFARSRYL